MLCTLQFCLRTEPVYIGTAAVLLSAAAAVFVYFLHPAGKTLCVISLSALLAFSVYSAELHCRIEPSSLTAGEKLQITGTLADYPQKKNNQYVYILKDCTRNGISIKENIKLYTRNIPQCRPGDTVQCRDLTVNSVEDSTQPILYRVYLQAYGSDVSVTHNNKPFFRYPFENLRHLIQQQLQENLSEDAAQVMMGLLVGSTSDMDNTLLQTFRRSGIAHLFAVSGLHVSFWSGLFIRLFGKRKYHRFFLTLTGLIILCFMTLTEFSPSVCRAGLSSLNHLFSKFLHRRSDGRNALGFALMVILCFNPCAADNASLLLSSGAAYVLIITAEPTEQLLSDFITGRIRIPVLQKITLSALSSFVLSVAVAMALMPLFARFFGCTSLFSPLTNILCCLPAEWAMVTGAFALLCGPIPFLSKLLFGITGQLLRYMIQISAVISNISFSCVTIEMMPVLIWFLVTVAGMLLLCRFRKNSLRVMFSAGAAGLCSFLLLLNIYEYSHRNELYFTAYPSYNGILAEIHDRKGNAAVFGCGTSYTKLQTLYNELCKSGADTVRLLFLPYEKTKSIQLIQAAITQLQPETTVASTALSEKLSGQDKIRYADDGKVQLWDDIVVSVSFSENSHTVVIEKEGTRIVLSFDGIPTEQYGSGDILLTRREIPGDINPDAFREIIITSSKKETEDSCTPTQNDKIISTADEGIIRRTYREEQWQS